MVFSSRKTCQCLKKSWHARYSCIMNIEHDTFYVKRLCIYNMFILDQIYAEYANKKTGTSIILTKIFEEKKTHKYTFQKLLLFRSLNGIGKNGSSKVYTILPRMSRIKRWCRTKNDNTSRKPFLVELLRKDWFERCESVAGETYVIVKSFNSVCHV